MTTGLANISAADRVNNWDEVGVFLIMILLTVTIIDLLSTAIRLRISHSGQSAPEGLAAIR